MKIKMVVFDIAGTTIKDDGSIAKAFSESLTGFGYNVPFSKIYPLMGFRKIEAIEMLLKEEQNSDEIISPEIIHSIHDRFVTIMKDYYTDAELVSLGAEEVFEQLQLDNIIVGINTGFPKSIAEIILQRLGWLESGMVNGLIASDEVPEGRPHPYMIQEMMKQFEIENPLAIVKVGDTAVDIAEGKNAGCRFSIGVTTGAYSREKLLLENPDYILDHLNELIPIIQAIDPA